MTTDFIAQYSMSKFGKEPKDLRVAIIHEDGAYGVARLAVIDGFEPLRT
ncbi:hypothetical protein ABIB82_000909 [Bradyrhizobium sp. i1.8.4]